MRKNTYTREARRLQPFVSSAARDAALIAVADDSGLLAAHLLLDAVSGHGSVGAHDHLTSENGGLLDHGSALTGKDDDDHTHYLNVARHDLIARHTLGTVVPHDDHGLLSGLTGDHHLQYFRVDGVRGMSGSVIPTLTDTWDLGSSTLLWRKGWLSELDAVLFAKNTVTLIGGWLLVTTNEGALAADVTAGATTIDFGQAMTTGHFVLFRAALKVEYMTVGSLVSGTTYNVTRNLDGTGANDWPSGTPYAVLGTSGSGRIELNAYDTPRISIMEQGATYNAQTEHIRLGNLLSWQSAGLSGFGIAMGSYAGNEYMYYTPTAGLVVRGTIRADDGYLAALTVSGLLSLDTSGELRAGTSSTGLRFGYISDGYYLRGVNGGTTQFEGRASDGRFYAGAGQIRMDSGGIKLVYSATTTAKIKWYLDDDFADVAGGLELYPQSGLGNPIAQLYVNDDEGAVYDYISIGNATYPGATMQHVRLPMDGYIYKRDPGVAVYQGLIYVSLGKSPVEVFTAGAKTTGTYNYLLTDLGLPSGIKAVQMLVGGRWSAASNSNYVNWKPYGGSTYTLAFNAQVADINAFCGGVVPVASDRITMVVAGADMAMAYGRIVGYFM